MFQEFKQFAMRGNVVDMAVGIIIGGAFGTIVKSLVDDVIMPPIGLLTGNVDFKQLALHIKEPVYDAAGKMTSPGVAINYGSFINNVITFLIVAWAVFLLVKGMNAAEARLTGGEPPSPVPPPPEEIALLRQIRDSLRKP
jgi:large conductance mechanosensitive channel